MISFRYHLVSIIAVFLALALGIVVGTTALNGPITKDLRRQVNSLKDDRTSLSDQVKALQGQVGDGQQFAQLYGQQIVKGALLGENVLIVGLPGASGAVKDDLARQVAAAGGKVTGRVQLSGDYTDPKQAGAVVKFATNNNPIGLTLPNTDQAGAIGGALLAFVLLGKGQPSDLTQVVVGFSQMHMLKLEGGGDSVRSSTNVIVVSNGTLPAQDARGRTDLALITQLQQQGGHVVLAGDTQAASQGGVVALVRGDAADRSAVATVDNADDALGQVSTIVALAEVGRPAPDTIVGHYGTASGAKALFPELAK